MIFGDFSAWTAQNLIIRIMVSMVLGCLIGLDRGMKHRGAGTKTITVVCLASTLVMLTEQYIQVNFPGLANMTRMAAQVISGVGFLGVGTIIISNQRVKGLTTAATLWASASVGLAVGIGFIDGGMLITLIMLCSLHVLPYVEHFATRRSRYCNVIIDMEESQYIHRIIQDLKEADISVDSMEITTPRIKGDSVMVHLVLYLKRPRENMELYEIITKSDKVISVDFLR